MPTVGASWSPVHNKKINKWINMHFKFLKIMDHLSPLCLTSGANKQPVEKIKRGHMH